MIARSWLLVPGDTEARLIRAAESGAHAIVVDLSSGAVPQARILARDWLQAHRRQVLENRRIARWVRINPIETGLWRDDLAAVMPAAPDGIILPRAASPDDVRQLAAELYELEQRHHTPNGSTRIIPMVGETPAAALGVTAYVDFPMPRLGGIGWNAASLAAGMRATRIRTASGDWTDVARLVRAHTLLVAHTRHLWAIDTLDEQAAETDVLAATHAACSDGFTGMFASDAAHVPLINAAFAPTPAELADAEAIVSAFALSPYAERLQVHGRMIDQPRLQAAKALLGVA
jgi:citrate lyase subunit beta/citryl-CoA lyase